MTNRYFELTENIPFDEAPELHKQFKHYLDHDLKVMFMPNSKNKHVVVAGRDGESITEIFGGENEKFIHLYYIEEYVRRDDLF
ncbi:MAG: hypothetical protein RSA84_11025 [Acinetobacter sp.]